MYVNMPLNFNHSLLTDVGQQLTPVETPGSPCLQQQASSPASAATSGTGEPELPPVVCKCSIYDVKVQCIFITSFPVSLVGVAARIFSLRPFTPPPGVSSRPGSATSGQEEDVRTVSVTSSGYESGRRSSGEPKSLAEPLVSPDKWVILKSLSSLRQVRFQEFKVFLLKFVNH